jgi:hypothetical protein
LGAQGYFFSIFEQGNFSIQEVEDNDPSRRELISLEITKTWNRFVIMTLEAVGAVNFNVRLKNVTFDIGIWGFEMKAKVTAEVSFQLLVVGESAIVCMIM